MPEDLQTLPREKRSHSQAPTPKTPRPPEKKDSPALPRRRLGRPLPFPGASRRSFAPRWPQFLPLAENDVLRIQKHDLCLQPRPEKAGEGLPKAKVCAGKKPLVQTNRITVWRLVGRLTDKPASLKSVLIPKTEDHKESRKRGALRGIGAALKLWASLGGSCACPSGFPPAIRTSGY